MRQAIENGAVVILGPKSLGKRGNTPVVQIANPRDGMHRMAAAFYNDPSQKMAVVGVTGLAAVGTSLSHRP